MADDLYDRYARVLAGESLPSAIVDLDAVDANIEQLAAPLRATGKALRIATKYPHLARTLLGARGLGIEILELQGSVELAPVVGLADAIVDLVETGRTLVENGLSERETLLTVTGRLVVNRASWRLKMGAVQQLVAGLERA